MPGHGGGLPVPLWHVLVTSWPDLSPRGRPWGMPPGHRAATPFVAPRPSKETPSVPPAAAPSSRHPPQRRQDSEVRDHGGEPRRPVALQGSPRRPSTACGSREVGRTAAQIPPGFFFFFAKKKKNILLSSLAPFTESLSPGPEDTLNKLCPLQSLTTARLALSFLVAASFFSFLLTG